MSMASEGTHEPMRRLKGAVGNTEVTVLDGEGADIPPTQSAARARPGQYLLLLNKDS